METAVHTAHRAVRLGIKLRYKAPQVTQLLLVSLVAGMGLAAAIGANIHDIQHSPLYITVATALLCFGLFMAGYNIPLQEARKHWRIVAVAITFGVVAKYLIIAGIAYLVTRDVRYAVLGMAVAQIDPLSVAALSKDRRLSPHVRAVLNMWASFDDPVTALATPVLLTSLAGAGGFQLAAGTSLQDTLLDLLPFAFVVAGTGLFALWRRSKGRTVREFAFLNELKEELRANEAEGPKTAIAHAVILVATVIRSAPLAAIFALFCRPAWLGGKIGEMLTKVALYGATFLLGLLLAGGVDITGGIVLGFATYCSQVVVAWLVVAISFWMTPKKKRRESHFSVRDVWHLALAQQNGITAIVLALVLQPSIPIAVSAVSLSIVVANLANFVFNGGFDKFVVPRLWPERRKTVSA